MATTTTTTTTTSTTYTRKINEHNPNEFFKLFDPETSHRIIVTTKHWAEQPSWRRDHANQTKKNCMINCVDKQKKEGNEYSVKVSHLIENSAKIAESETPLNRTDIINTQKFFIEHATIMYLLNLTEDNIVYFCRSGRSRTPSIVMLYLLLFKRHAYEGVSLTPGKVKAWLTHSFREQRATTYQQSKQWFPNWGKFVGATIVPILQKSNLFDRFKSNTANICK